MSTQPQAPPERRTQSRAIVLIYGASFSYQITLGLIQVLVPLYALHLGYDLTRARCHRRVPRPYSGWCCGCSPAR